MLSNGGTSNIVFSSGGFDGWSAGGVATNETGRGLYSILIPNGAHHLDLMFSHENDPDDVIRARQFEMSQVRKWTQEYHARTKAKSWGDML